MNKTDKKVLEYLERSREIVINAQSKYKDEFIQSDADRAVVEIAKMIQREEQNEN